MDYRFDDVDQLCVNTIRTLAMDAVERANSGHPGAPMGLAPVAHVLFSRLLVHSPEHPEWANRDRFVLSAGHASTLLYATLHLHGYPFTLADIKGFRQWGSITPGHPEHDPSLGVEMTTGPLGQGCATSVGMAMAEVHLAATFNKDDEAVFDHHTWVVCGDGDLMEGVSAEAASMAGHLGLGKLIWIWDDNRITIEGGTDLAFSENVVDRFRSYGWRVLEVEDVNDLDAVAAALDEARGPSERPTLVRVRSHIAYGAPNKQDTAGAHGAPLGRDEILAAKSHYSFPSTEDFHIPEAALERCRDSLARGRKAHYQWQEAFTSWCATNPEMADDLDRRLNRHLPANWLDSLPTFPVDSKGLASRASSGKVLNALAASLPELIGGSADLGPSCKTTISDSTSFSATNPKGRILHFGIREHAMGSVLNGLALHGGLRPFGSTFLVFSDYMRPAIRLAALMKQPAIFVFTHDSVWVGEDGPTHQPVEHIMALRLIPDLVVLRPADANETAAAWRVAIERTDGPTALILSRQALPTLEGSVHGAASGVAHGAYAVREATDPNLVLLASGSEVSLAMSAADTLALKGFSVRVVSMPSWELFDRLPRAYRLDLLGEGVPRVAIEAGVSRGWEAYVGDRGEVIGIDRFGASAPGKEVASRLGMNIDNILARAIAVLGSNTA